jgi:hypothetical protein
MPSRNVATFKQVYERCQVNRITAVRGLNLPLTSHYGQFVHCRQTSGESTEIWRADCRL